MCLEGKRMRLLGLALLALLSSSVSAKRKHVADCELCDYVYQDDGYYGYTEVENTVVVSGVTTYKLNLTSIKWNDESFCSPSVWTHNLIVNVPDTVKHKTGFISFDGYMNTVYIDLSTEQYVGYLARMAAQTNSVTAVVFNIPIDPITFQTPGGPVDMDSDQALAYTSTVFRQIPSVNILAYTGIVKACVKAMDAVQEFASSLSKPVEKFVLAGASKRSYAAWLIPVMDDRVAATVPITGNLLNYEKMLLHTYQSLNASWPFYFSAWLITRSTDIIGDPKMRLFEKYTDALLYLKSVDVPKLMVMASQDDLFPIDNTFLFRKYLRGERRYLILENAGHFFQLYPSFPEFLTALQAYYQTILNDTPRPRMNIRKRILCSGTGKISVKTNVEATYVAAYVASSTVSNRRDFRRFYWCNTCTPIKLCDLCPALPLNNSGDIWREDTAVISKESLGNGRFRYSAKYSTPQNGYRQFYIKMRFPGGLVFTSDSLVLPNTTPTESTCSGAACTGSAVV